MNTHTTVSNIHRDVLNTHVIVSDAKHVTSNTQTIVSSVQHTVANTHAIVSDIQHTMAKHQEGSEGQDLLVSTTCSPLITEQTSLLTRLKPGE